MIYWRALVCHLIVNSILPGYYAIRFCTKPDYSDTISPIGLSISAFIWIFYFTRFTIPVLTSPTSHLPVAHSDSIPWGHFALSRKEPEVDLLYRAVANTPNDGIVIIWDILYSQTRLILTKPDLAMEVFNTNCYDWVKLRPVVRLLKRVLGNGLVFSEGDQHKAMRKSVAPAFSGRHIRDLVPLFWSKGVEFADVITREVRESVDGTVEVSGLMSRVTLDLIGAAGIGHDFQTIEHKDNNLARQYDVITNSDRGPIGLFFLIMAYLPQWLILQLRGTIYSRIANATIQLRVIIQGLLAEKKQALAEKTAQNDIITTIMRSGDFDDEYLCDQLLTFLAAGHDTTASALTWALWLLAQQPAMQDRLRKECQDHLGSKARHEVDANIFDQMPYLTAVCNETLRLYPPVPGTSRCAATDTVIGGMPVQKGQICIVVPWAMNRLPSLWGPNPHDFNPDRWLEGPNAANGGAKHPYAMMTFLHGPRSCIGQGFSRVEMKCLLAALVGRFEVGILDGSPEVVVGGFVTIKPEGGLRLRLRDLLADVKG